MKVDNSRRIRTGTMGTMGTTDDDGCNGVFIFIRPKYQLNTIASEGMDWEHVSVTRSDRKMPTWLDMCYVKERFWDDEDTIMQLHPPKSEWISNHDKCLHLWRPISSTIPLPPSIMVGIKGLDSQDIERRVLNAKDCLK